MAEPKNAEEVILHRLKINRRIFKDICWKWHEAIIKKIPPNYRPSILKFIWKEHPTMKKISRYNKEITDECPLCGQCDESLHFLHCKRLKNHPASRKTRTSLDASLRKQNLNPITSTWIRNVLNGNTPEVVEGVPLRLKNLSTTVFSAQSRIGWGNMICGRIPKSTVLLQEWWKKDQDLTEEPKSEDILIKSFTLTILHVYELWKERCSLIHEKQLSPQKEVVYQRVCSLKELENQYPTEYEDRKLFLSQNVPRVSDTIEKMSLWIQCIENSLKRKAD